VSENNYQDQAETSSFDEQGGYEEEVMTDPKNTRSLREKREKVKGYQKKLVPINIVTCVLALVAALSLFFMPILKIDLGKIISSDGVRAYIVDTIESSLGTNNGTTTEEGGDQTVAKKLVDSEGEENSSSKSSSGLNSEDILSMIDMKELILPILDPILNTLAESDISISVTAFDSYKVSKGGSNALSEVLTDMVTKVSKNLINGLTTALTGADTINTIIDTALEKMIDLSVTYLSDEKNVAVELAQQMQTITAEQKAELLKIVKKVDTMTSAKDADAIVDELSKTIIGWSGGYLSEEVLDEYSRTVATYLAVIYNSTMERVEEAGRTDVTFSIETALCVQLSDKLDSFFEMLEELGVEDSSNSDSTEGGYDENGYQNSRKLLGANIVATAEEESGTTDSTTESKVIFSYSELIGDETMAALEAKITEAVNSYVDGAEEQMESISQYFVYIFYVCAIFIALWLIQFLFAFFHIFAKNKRFHMWYAKFLCWIPPMIWLTTFLMSKESFIAKLLTQMNAGAAVPASLIAGVASGITSFTWVSGACLLALWIVSIFWAFPIKHKIRKMNKQIKREVKANKRAMKAAA
jgi:hypothetical protein